MNCTYFYPHKILHNSIIFRIFAEVLMVNNQSSMVNEIRTYGRTELAQLYFPAICPRAAWAKLRLYMSDYPRLRKLLACKRRTFLPIEVSLIFDTLGRP
jgi:hypothetical protein